MKVLLSIAATAAVALPALADVTTLTFLANVDPVISLRIENLGTTTIVSGDDADPAPFSGTNEVLNFGTVSPLGTIGSANNINAISGAGAGYATTGGLSKNGAAGTITRHTINSSRVTFTPESAGSQPATGTHKGAIYTISGAIQLRALRNTNLAGVAAGTTDVAVDVSGTNALEAVVAPSAQDFVANGTIPANYFYAPTAAMSGAFDQTGGQQAFRGTGAATGETTPLDHDSAFPITVGIHIPLNSPAVATTTKITFTGS